MLRINKFEEVRKSTEKIILSDVGINYTMYWAYISTVEQTKNELIDFADVIWDTDIEAIANTMREEGIKEFTISSNFSGLLKTLAEFEKYDISLVGMTEVNSRYTDWKTGELEKIPAVKMIVK